MKEQAYNKDKDQVQDSRNQCQSNLKNPKVEGFKDLASEEIVSLKILSQTRKLVSSLERELGSICNLILYVLRAEAQAKPEPDLCNLPLERRHLWSDLGMHKYVVSRFPWVLIGDFKVALNLEDSFSVVSKMKLLKKPLRKLLHDQGNLHERVKKLKLELDEVQKALDTNLADSILREEECVYVQAFKEAKLNDERLLNVEINFLGLSTDCNILNEEGLFSNKVPADIASNMVRDVTNDEIKAAMFDIGDDRAPGPDGYTSVFFKKGWDIVGDDICNAVRDFFSNGLLLKEINHTFLALIPKVSTPLRVNDYRPISCCNVIYKCISKIITNRIMEGIKEVVSDNQSAFIPGRRISDNILITQELMHNYHRNRGSPRCAFKIDIQKAYDTVDWNFLENILIKFGFHNTMVKWIMACVSSTSFSLSINGNIHGFFKGKRGLRQGDPLSPYLFTLVMEILTLILKRQLKRSKATIAWDDICLPKSEGGLGFRNLKVFNFALMTTHIWNIISSKESLWVRWIHTNKLQGRTIWDVPVKDEMNLVSNRTWSWPQSWLLKAPDLDLITCPALVSSVTDLWQWRDRNGNISSFSVAKAWEAIRLHGNQVAWSRIVWFLLNIPLHAFHLWLVTRHGLKTHDKMRQWDVGAKVWSYVRDLVVMDLIPPVLQDIFLYLLPMGDKRTAKSVFGKLILSASAYFIWMERNNRTFKNTRRSPEEIRDLIMVTVQLKFISFWFKNTNV
ncbi:aspartic peptidase, partial [Tanacetum coccineum]